MSLVSSYARDHSGRLRRDCTVVYRTEVYSAAGTTLLSRTPANSNSTVSSKFANDGDRCREVSRPTSRLPAEPSHHGVLLQIGGMVGIAVAAVLTSAQDCLIHL